MQHVLDQQPCVQGLTKYPVMQGTFGLNGNAVALILNSLRKAPIPTEQSRAPLLDMHAYGHYTLMNSTPQFVHLLALCCDGQLVQIRALVVALEESAARWGDICKCFPSSAWASCYTKAVVKKGSCWHCAATADLCLRLPCLIYLLGFHGAKPHRS